MLKYNLGLIKQGTRILLLNREHPSWMGCWNGVGGKVEKKESPRLSMMREIVEETQIDPPNLDFKGLITWTTEGGSEFGGMYLYLVELPHNYDYETPINTDEGILDWKEIDWILHPQNQGIASNIPSCLEKVLYDNQCYNHHSIFKNGTMIDQISEVIDPVIERDDMLREDYLSRYIRDFLLSSR